MPNTLRELADRGVVSIGTGPFGSALHASDYVDVGVPVVPTEAIRDGRIDHTKLVFVPPAKAEELRRYQISPGDLVFARRGAQACGLSAIVDEHDGEAIGGTGVMILRVHDHARVYPKYLALSVGSADSVSWLKKHAIGATMPNLNSNILLNLPVCLPEYPEQVAIADFLASFDQKLDLIRRVNGTLEQIAQNIFHAWFVDFLPVRAKVAACAESRDPLRAAMCALSCKGEVALDLMPREQYEQLAATATLFPDELVDSDLGEVPLGWETGKLADFCHINARSWSTRSLPEIIEYVDLSNTKNGEIADVQPCAKDKAPSRARRILSPGDTIVGTVRPANRSFALVGGTEHPLTGSTGFAVLSPRIPGMREFVYLAATSEENISRLHRLADGAAYPAVRPEIVADEDIVVPPKNVMLTFHELVGPLFDLRLQNQGSNRILAALRDALLPKLLSGEIRVGEAQELAEAVA